MEWPAVAGIWQLATEICTPDPCVRAQIRILSESQQYHFHAKQIAVQDIGKCSPKALSSPRNARRAWSSSRDMFSFEIRTLFFSGKTSAIDETELTGLPEIPSADKLLLVINPHVLYMHEVFLRDDCRPSRKIVHTVLLAFNKK